ncbi:MAG: hypothetical protein II373_03955, partial [Clostridia bacterium]|nr:hypothetical protein [Clostridia bacterium]
NDSAFIAKNSVCEINLNGGKISSWLAMSRHTVKSGYENGIILNIGESFDLSQSFQTSIEDQDNGVVSDGTNLIFYGFSGDCVFVKDNIEGIGASKVYIAASKYAEYKDSYRFRGFAEIASGEYHPPVPTPSTQPDDTTAAPDDTTATPGDTTATPDDTTAPDNNTTIPDGAIYISDNGNDSNDGLSADKPLKTLTKSYSLLGEDGGTLVIVGTFSPVGHFCAPAHTGKVTIMGVDSSARWIVKGGTRRFQAGGPTEFTKIIIEQNKDMLFVANFNDFTISPSVVHDKKAGNSFIVAGGQGGTTKGADSNYTVKSSTLSLYSGYWSEVIGSFRSSLNSLAGKHDVSEFANYDLVINVGKDVTVGKLAAFSRISSDANFVAKNSSCTVNLIGGKVNAWIAMSDAKKDEPHGYENGLIVNIGEDFDLSKSFQEGASKQKDNTITDSDNNVVFYGINGETVYVRDGYSKIGASKVCIADSKYEAYKDSDRFRDVTVDDGAVLPDAPEADDEQGGTQQPAKPKKKVYLSDNGSDSNDGLSAETPFKTLTKCYSILGDEGGFIIVVDTFTPSGHFLAPDHKGKVTIMGANSSARYIISGGTRRFQAGGPTEFTDIILEQNKDMLFVARFNNFTISSTVVHEKNAGNSFIVAGGQGGTTKGADKDYTVKSAALTLNGGYWSEVIGSLRSSLNSPSGTHSPDEFKDYTIVINIGGNATVGKLSAFSRAFTKADILARNSECVINLNGGQVKYWIGMSDSTASAKNGYEDGIIINIGPNFDLSGSF